MSINQIKKLTTKSHLRRLCLVLGLAVCFTASPLLPVTGNSGVAFAERSTSITTSDITKDPFEASIIDYMRTVYPEKSLFPPGTGALCYQFALKFHGMMSENSKTVHYDGVKVTKKNIMEKLGDCPPGTIVRFGRSDNSYGSHSIIILKVTNDRVWWSECNRNGYNLCHYYTNTLDGFVRYSAYFNYICYKVEPTKDEGYVTPILYRVKEASDDEKVYLSWVTTTNTEEYRINRSVDGGDFETIDIVESGYRYTDDSVESEHTYKYKITAVKKSGKTTTSGYKTIKL